jgi:hypothetical protein
MRTIAVLAVVGLIAAGCTPEAKPEPETTGVKACAVAELDGQAQWKDMGGAGGHIGWVALLRNASKVTCVLEGSAAVWATDPETKTHGPLEVKQGTFFDGDWQVIPATVKPGEQAGLTIVSGTGCNGGLGLLTYTDVEIAIGNRKWTLDGLEVVADKQDCLLSAGRWFTPAPGYEFGQ